jgi:hypothetical protein
MPQATIAVSLTDKVANISSVYTLSDKGKVYHRDAVTNRWTKTVVGPNTAIYLALQKSKTFREPLIMFPSGETQSVPKDKYTTFLPDWAVELIHLD